MKPTRCRSGSTCALRPTRSSTSSARTAARTASAPGPRRSAPTSTPSASKRSARASPATASARTTSSRPRASVRLADENFTGGTIIGLGGHLHPGGIRNEVDLVRDGEQPQRIYTGDPDLLGPRTTGPSRAARPTRGTSRCASTACRTTACTSSRATSCARTPPTTRRSIDTYENMGIVVVAARARGRERQQAGAGRSTRSRRPSTTPSAATRVACRQPRRRCARTASTRPTGTTGRTPTAAGPRAGEAAANGRGGPETSEIAHRRLPLPAGRPDAPRTRSASRRSSSARTCGSRTPTAPAILHTITTCKFPCLGPTGGGVPAGRRRDEPGPAGRARLRPARLLGARDQRGQERARLDHPGHERGGLPGRRGRDVLLPHPSLDARRVRGRRLAVDIARKGHR